MSYHHMRFIVPLAALILLGVACPRQPAAPPPPEVVPIPIPTPLPVSAPTPTPPPPPSKYDLNCGSDIDCMNYHLARCSVGASVTSGISRLATYKYTIKTKTTTTCVIHEEFTKNINPAFVGPTMDCTASLSVKTMNDLVAFHQSDNYASCAGPLKNLLVPS